MKQEHGYSPEGLGGFTEVNLWLKEGVEPEEGSLPIVVGPLHSTSNPREGELRLTT